MRTQGRDRLRARGIAFATTAILAVSAAPASAYSVARDWVATDYATGFPAQRGNGVGPLGLAFDGGGNLLVTDNPAGSFYRVPPGGGTAADSFVTGGLGQPAGLAFGLDGGLYMDRPDRGKVDQIDPANARVLRTVASGMPCPTGLATDPLSGDLFVSNKCQGGAITRVGPLGSASPSATPYAAEPADGLTFAPDGTLFAAAAAGRVDRIEGTNSPFAGSATKITDAPEVDGIAYAPASGGNPPYLVVDRNTGDVDRLDFDGRMTPILTSGSRGDLVTVGPDHCIYATLRDRIVKLAPASGNCNFAPPPGLVVLGRRVTGRRVLDLVLRVRARKRVRPGRRFTYQIRVTNKGPGIAHKVIVHERLAKGLRFVRLRHAKKTKCARKRRVIECGKTTLARRGSFTLRVTVRAMRGKRYRNVAVVGSKDLDRAPGNNRARNLTRITRRR